LIFIKQWWDSPPCFVREGLLIAMTANLLSSVAPTLGVVPDGIAQFNPAVR
jgi:hypothetical protein